MKVASLKFSEEEPSFHDIGIDDEGNVRYYNEKGQLHRLDGPAVEFFSGSKKWYENDKLHRLDGPATEWANSYKEWWVNNEYIGSDRLGFTPEDFERWKKEHGYENS